MDKRPDDRVRASRQPHRRGLKSGDRLDEKAESPLGRMLLSGDLAAHDEASPWPACAWPRDVKHESACYEAGLLYARVATIYAAQLGVPIVKSAQIAIAADSLPADGEVDRSDRYPDLGCAVERFGVPDVCFSDPDNCQCHCRREQYDRAVEALMRAGQRAAKVVARVAVHREAIAAEDFVYLNLGLSALARHFGLIHDRN